MVMDVCRGKREEHAARQYADLVCAFFHSHGLSKRVFGVRGPTSTTKCPFEVVTESCGYTIVYRTKVVDSPANPDHPTPREFNCQLG